MVKLYIFIFRTQEFKIEGNLTYNGCKVNKGGAVNISTGIFTAPRKGIYQFTFHANTVRRMKMNTSKSTLKFDVKKEYNIRIENLLS